MGAFVRQMLGKDEVYGSKKAYITFDMNIYLNHNKFREMDLTPEHKKEIERKLVETVIQALEQEILTSEEVDVLTPFIYEQMTQKVKTHEELVVFLRDLSTKSNIFSYLLVTESGEVKEKEDKETAEKAEDLIKTGNIDEAMEIVKEANNA